MSAQASVRSIDSLKDLRVALALYGDDTLSALGAVEAEIRRTLRWLQEERPVYWTEQIKRRREQVSAARAEVFKKNLQKRADYNPPMSEQKENLRKAELSLQDAEKRLTAVRKWQPLFKQAVLEYHASVQRIKDLSASDVPRAVNVLTRMIDALESYLRVAVPAGAVVLEGSATGPSTTMANAIPAAEIDSVATTALDEDEASARELAQARDPGASTPGAEARAPDSEADGAPDLEPHSDGEAPDA
jgi:hypothetical protein